MSVEDDGDMLFCFDYFMINYPTAITFLFAGDLFKFVLCKHTNCNIDDKNDVRLPNQNLSPHIGFLYLYLGPPLRTWTGFESRACTHSDSSLRLR